MTNLLQSAPSEDSLTHCTAASQGSVSRPQRAILIARLWAARILSIAAHMAAPTELNVDRPGCTYRTAMPIKRDLVTVRLEPTRSREERYDRLYKSAGMTHRVQIRMLHEIGQAELIFWMRNPSENAITEALQRRGVFHRYDAQLIEL